MKKYIEEELAALLMNEKLVKENTVFSEHRESILELFREAKKILSSNSVMEQVKNACIYQINGVYTNMILSNKGVYHE